MTEVADRYAHRLAMHLELFLSDYGGQYYNDAINTLGEYRSAMNRIHERHSPTHMGEPVLPKVSVELNATRPVPRLQTLHYEDSK
jgi:hypothetical protein